MSKLNFDAYLNEKSVLDNSQMDWDKTRDDWIKALKQFYITIEGFLKEYVDSGKLEYSYLPQQRYEDYIGRYAVDVMIIKLRGGDVVTLEPIGTNLIGVNGRVDLIGAKSKVKFVWVNEKYSTPSPIKVAVRCNKTIILSENEPEFLKNQEEVKLAWKISTSPPKIKYIDLNQDVFFDAVLEVIGG